MANQYYWSQGKALSKWMLNNRLDGFSKVVRDALGDSDKEELRVAMRSHGMPAVVNLTKSGNQHKN